MCVARALKENDHVRARAAERIGLRELQRVLRAGGRGVITAGTSRSAVRSAALRAGNSVEHAIRGGVREPPDRGDATGPDADVGGEGREPCAVDDRAAADQEVVVGHAVPPARWTRPVYRARAVAVSLSAQP